MSEKRFYVDDDGIYDTQEKKHFKFIAYDWIDCDIYECCEKLNEQQAIIQRFGEYVFSDERIVCYNCLFCQEKDIYEVKCKIKGSVDVHGTCQYYEKKRCLDE